MPTQEERLATLEQSMTYLKSDINDINHNETLLLGLAMKQAENMRELKLSVAEFKESVTNRFDQMESMLAQVLARLPEKP